MMGLGRRGWKWRHDLIVRMRIEGLIALTEIFVIDDNCDNRLRVRFASKNHKSMYVSGIIQLGQINPGFCKSGNSRVPPLVYLCVLNGSNQAICNISCMLAVFCIDVSWPNILVYLIIAQDTIINPQEVGRQSWRISRIPVYYLHVFKKWRVFTHSALVHVVINIRTGHQFTFAGETINFPLFWTAVLHRLDHQNCTVRSRGKEFNGIWLVKSVRCP